jgi:hypothetical protein
MRSFFAVHLHCYVIDRVFADGEGWQVHFGEAEARTPEDLAAVQQQVSGRVLRWFARAGHLDPADAREMAVGSSAPPRAHLPPRLPPRLEPSRDT